MSTPIEQTFHADFPTPNGSQEIHSLHTGGPHSIQSLLLWVVPAQSLSHDRLFATPWTIAHQAPPSLGFPKQEYWSGLPFPTPGDLSDPGMKPASPVSSALACEFFITASPGSFTVIKALLLE